jgi:hypothetical protein
MTFAAIQKSINIDIKNYLNDDKESDYGRADLHIHTRM